MKTDKGTIFAGRPNLKAVFTEPEVEFICKLGEILSCINLDQDDKDYLMLVFNHSERFKALADLEGKAFSEYQAEALSMWPAVLKELREQIMSNYQTSDILNVFIDLQMQFYRSVPQFIKNLGDNKSIRLLGLSKEQNQVLTQFVKSPNRENFHFEATAGECVNITLLQGPVPTYRAIDEHQNASEGQHLAQSLV